MKLRKKEDVDEISIDVDEISIDVATLPRAPQNIELDAFEVRPFKSRTPVGAAERAYLPSEEPRQSAILV